MNTEGLLLSSHNLSNEVYPGITVFPNPFTEGFVVEGNYINGISIYNIEGIMVFAEKTIPEKGQKVKISLPDVPEGNYLITVETKRGSVTKGITKN